MKYFIHAKNNIRKSISSTITLILLIGIATLFLYTGINVLFQMNEFIDAKNEELNGAHEVAIVTLDVADEIQTIMEKIPGFSGFQEQDGLIYNTSKFENKTCKEDSYVMPAVFLPLDTSNVISRIDVIDPAEKDFSNGIIMPYIMKAGNGYHTGDLFEMYVDGKSKQFRIAGFYEDVLFASPTNVSLYKMYVTGDQISEMKETLGGQECAVSLATLDDVDKAEVFETQMLAEIKKEIENPSQIIMTSNYESLKIGTSVFILIIMSVLVAFSGVILLISMIVIRFSIKSQIENNMKNIGTMEAAGYTPKQLIRAVQMEYSIVAVAGVLIGISVSAIVTPFITQIISASIGLRWIAFQSIANMGISFFAIWMITLIISLISGAKIKKITPLTALRSGIENHNFQKNPISLEKSKWNLHMAISLKECIFHIRQNLVIGFIIALLCVVCIMSESMYYNFVTDDSAMMNLVGIETAHAVVNLPEDEKVYREIRQMKEVEDTVLMDEMEMTVHYIGKETNPHFLITDDFGKLKVKTCVKGRMPKYENEISMTQRILDDMGASLGDVVSVEYNNESQEFLIVGVTQHISYLGKGAEITTEGMERLSKKYENKRALLYLKDNVNTEKFLTKISDQYKNQGIQVANNIEMLNKMMESFGSSMKIITGACIMITLLIIVFILYLVIKVRIMKERMSMGILKALGFTSVQLISHVVMSLAPVVILGSSLGAVLGFFLTNPLIAMSLAGNGILKCNFIITNGMLILTPLFISFMAFLAALWISSGIRKIYPCTMLRQ